MILVILSLVFVWIGFFRHRNLVNLISLVFNIAVIGLTTATMIDRIVIFNNYSWYTCWEIS